MMKPKKQVDDKETKAETAAWQKFHKQTVMPFLTPDERIEDAFRTAYRAGRKLELDKIEKKEKRNKWAQSSQ